MRGTGLVCHLLRAPGIATDGIGSDIVATATVAVALLHARRKLQSVTVKVYVAPGVNNLLGIGVGGVSWYSLRRNDVRLLVFECGMLFTVKCGCCQGRPPLPVELVRSSTRALQLLMACGAVKTTSGGTGELGRVRETLFADTVRHCEHCESVSAQADLNTPLLTPIDSPTEKV